MKALGKYMLFLHQIFTRREKTRVYIQLFFEECIHLGYNSIPISALVAIFIGAVSAIQTADNLISPLIPLYIVGTVVRDMTILELAPSITCIVLAGKVGSRIAGSIGSMRIKEQIDALDIMGINSASYLVLPKILAALFTFPFLVVIAGFLGHLGGYLASTLTNRLTPMQYIYGIRYEFVEFNVAFALIKTFIFAFLIVSISSYQGYYTRGGALEVGQSSTSAVTKSCIAILVADFITAQLLL